MDPVFKKMNLKDQREIVVLSAPESFEQNISGLSDEIKVIRSVKEVKEIEYLVSFVTRKEEIDNQAEELKGKLEGDAIVWFCYPKGSSKKYKCDFNRDTGWASLGEAGMEPVRQVAVDEDWSALRFRRVEYIKNMTRRKSMAMTKEGKSKTSGKGN